MRIRHILFLAVCFLLVVAFMFPIESPEKSEKKDSELPLIHVINDVTEDDSNEIPNAVAHRATFYIKKKNYSSAMGKEITVTGIEVRKKNITGGPEHDPIVSFPQKTVNGKTVHGISEIKLADPTDEGIETYHTFSFADIPATDHLPADYMLNITYDVQTTPQRGTSATRTDEEARQKALAQTDILKFNFPKKTEIAHHTITVYPNDSKELEEESLVNRHQYGDPLKQ